jgi:hypothetical protein
MPKTLSYFKIRQQTDNGGHNRKENYRQRRRISPAVLVKRVTVTKVLLQDQALNY